MFCVYCLPERWASRVRPAPLTEAYLDSSTPNTYDGKGIGGAPDLQRYWAGLDETSAYVTGARGKPFHTPHTWFPSLNKKHRTNVCDTYLQQRLGPLASLGG